MQADTESAGQLILCRVAEKLYRTEPTGISYAIPKAKGWQIKRSLKPSDRQLARRRLDDLRNKIVRMTTAVEGEALTLYANRIEFAP
ncbi:MAG TPA: hypothetical protein VLZ12_16300 [Verrucomicrobiae bacterium]|nr:hypothetical protein [Verrucomicrobiae bacterium]